MIELKPYEIEILQLVAKGFSTKEIAKKTKYSPNSVETFRLRIHAKIGAKNSSHAIYISLRKGIIQ